MTGLFTHHFIDNSFVGVEIVCKTGIAMDGKRFIKACLTDHKMGWKLTTSRQERERLSW
jgi:hypothetical protein